MRKREWLTTAEAAKDLGLTPAGVRWHADRGKLRIAGRTRGGVRFFDPADVEQFRAERERALLATGEGEVA